MPVQRAGHVPALRDQKAGFCPHESRGGSLVRPESSSRRWGSLSLSLQLCI